MPESRLDSMQGFTEGCLPLKVISHWRSQSTNQISASYLAEKWPNIFWMKLFFGQNIFLDKHFFGQNIFLDKNTQTQSHMFVQLCLTKTVEFSLRILDIWYFMSDTWNLILDILYLIYVTWYLILDIGYLLFDTW